MQIKNDVYKENMRCRDEDAFRNDIMEPMIGAQEGSSTVGFQRGWRISRLHWGGASGTPVWEKSTLVW